jgi:hypothetical protein
MFSMPSPFPKNINNEAWDIGREIDKAFDEKREPDVESILAKANSLLPNIDIYSQAHLHYFLGTMYGDLTPAIPKEREQNIEHKLFHFRKCIDCLLDLERSQDFEIFRDFKNLQLKLYVNYAVLLVSCGRLIPALEYYSKALMIKPDFAIAIGNSGMSYFRFASRVTDEGHSDVFHFSAYHLLLFAIAHPEDLSKDQIAKYTDKINQYTHEYRQKYLNTQPSFPKCTYDGKELDYRTWALENRLFLNPLNDLYLTSYCFAKDAIQLPEITLPRGEYPIYHGIFNQIKQEYIFARYLYYEALKKNESPHFFDKDTELVCAEIGGRYSISLEKMKTTFRILYSLFDRIAYFLNIYYHLDIKVNQIDFRKIWSYPTSNNKELLKISNNEDLNALYWISKDFYDPKVKSTNPDAERLINLRNYLEHRYVVIQEDYLSPPTEKRDDSEKINQFVEYISEEELHNRILSMLRLTREAILTLAMAVQKEERERNQDRLEKKVQIVLPRYEDGWKL